MLESPSCRAERWRPARSHVIAMVASDTRDSKLSQVEDYWLYATSSSTLDLEGIYQRIQSDFTAGSSGVYFAKPLTDILTSKRLDGCQDWGRLWSHIIRALGFDCTYIQCVDTRWLDTYAATWRGDGWRGHVFLEVGFGDELVTFCSTTARQVNRTGFLRGRDVIDGTFIVLFEGGGPEEFEAENQEGINRMLFPLVEQWL